MLLSSVRVLSFLILTTTDLPEAYFLGAVLESLLVPGVWAWARPQAPDYILLAGAPFLRPSFYTPARHATLNRPLGLLPDFRGSDCAIWALALDRPEAVGYSIHVVNERVDGGDVVLRRPMSINGDRGLEDYLRRLRREASEAFAGVVTRPLKGAAVRAGAQARKGPYFPPAGGAPPPGGRGGLRGRPPAAPAPARPPARRPPA